MYGKTTVADIASVTEVHGNTIRRWADKGLIPCRKDFRGWRYFPDPLVAIKKVNALVNGDTEETEQHQRL